MILFLGFYIFSGSEGSVAEWLERWKFNSRSDRLLDLFSIVTSSNPRPRELANGLHTDSWHASAWPHYH